MYRSVRAALVAAVVVPMALQAQGAADCRIETRDACQKAQDLYAFMLPQLGLGLAGGNPVLGSSSVIGKFPHVSVGLRASVFKGNIPKFDDIDVVDDGPVASNIPLEETWLGAAAFDGALGLFQGFTLGVTRVLSLDALVSLTYIPKFGDDDGGESDVEVDGTTKFGFGGRIGLLEESVAIPGVSFSYLQRGLPKLTLNTDANTAANFSVEELDIKVAAWRIMANKNFLAFSLNAGYGKDKYTSDGVLTASAFGFSESVTLDRDLDRTNWFVGLAINLGPVKLAGEYGQGGKSDVTTVNVFNPAAGDKLKYYSAGLRIAF